MIQKPSKFDIEALAFHCHLSGNTVYIYYNYETEKFESKFSIIESKSHKIIHEYYPGKDRFQKKNKLYKILNKKFDQFIADSRDSKINQILGE